MQETESNILDSLKLDKSLKLAKQKSKEGSSAEARTIYKDILYKFPKKKQLGLLKKEMRHSNYE